MNRRNTILGIVLIAQLVLVIFLYNSGSSEHKSEITLTDFEPENIISLTISDSYGSSTKLQKQDGKWLIDPPENYPADKERVKSALKKLANLKSERLVSSSKGSHGRLRVGKENFNRLISLEDSGGNKYQIFLGTTQGRGVYARKGGSDDVVFVNKLSSWEFATSPRSWWKTSMVDFTTDAVNRLELKNSKGIISIARDSNGRWVDKSGATLDQDKVKKFLLAIKNIRLSEYLGKNTSSKLDKAEATLKISLEKGKEITIEIGPEENSQRLVRASNIAHLLKVRSSELKKILEARADDFKSAPHVSEDAHSSQAGNATEKR